MRNDFSVLKSCAGSERLVENGIAVDEQIQRICGKYESPELNPIIDYDLGFLYAMPHLFIFLCIHIFLFNSIVVTKK